MTKANILISLFIGSNLHQRWRIIKNLIFSYLGFLQLRYIFICPSHKCNANCVHCYEKFNHKNFQKFLTTEEIKDIINQFYKIGGLCIYFCSGEFLLRDDALDLIKYASSKNIFTNVVTNGIILDEKKINDLKSAGLTTLMVSIDSAIATRHDQLRGIDGCLERAIRGIKLALKNGIATMIWTYVSKSNFNELAGISELAKSIWDKLPVFTYLPILSGHFFNKFDENLTYEEREILRKRFNPSTNVFLEFESEKSECRGGGREHISIMPSGDVTFCPPVPYSYGNIRTESVRSCLKKIKKDYKLFPHCTKGQCPINFPEYREKCNAKFMY